MEQPDKTALGAALEKLFERDGLLLERGAWETTVSAKLVDYLQKEYCDHDVDHEYDKHLENPKLIARDRPQRPDIVIHKRGVDDSNHIAIEIKTKESSFEDDEEKLRVLTNKNPPNPGRLFGYNYGIHIIFAHKQKRIATITVYTNGLVNADEGNDLRSYLREKLPYAWRD